MMHQIIRDNLEQVLAGKSSSPEHPAGKHLAECEECRSAVAAMRQQAAMLHQLRVSGPLADVEPRPGFYARVMERIESQTPGSVFTLFFDSPFGRRIAMAALALALLLGVYVISSEQMAEPQVASIDALPQATLVSDTPQVLPDVFADYGQPHLVTSAPDENAVLVNLVTYREQ